MVPVHSPSPASAAPAPAKAQPPCRVLSPRCCSALRTPGSLSGHKLQRWLCSRGRGAALSQPQPQPLYSQPSALPAGKAWVCCWGTSKTHLAQRTKEELIPQQELPPPTGPQFNFFCSFLTTASWHNPFFPSRQEQGAPERQPGHSGLLCLRPGLIPPVDFAAPYSSEKGFLLTLRTFALPKSSKASSCFL